MSALVCPACGAAELAVVVRLTGYAQGGAEKVGAERSFVYDGWTDVDWDSSEEVGLACRVCSWEQTTATGPNLSELVPERD